MEVPHRLADKLFLYDRELVGVASNGFNPSVYFHHQVYVFGPDAKTHDAICGMPGSFEQTLKHVERSRDVEALTIIFPVLPENYSLLGKTVTTLSKRGARAFHFLYPHDELVKGTVAQLKKIVQTLSEPVARGEKADALRLTAQEDVAVPLGIAIGWPLTVPRRAVIEICNDCNLRCDFCWTHSPSSRRKLTEKYLGSAIPKETVFKYVDELAKFKVKLVELCAIGDPLFHPDIWEMIDYIKAYGLKVRVSTNGTMISPKRAERLVQIGVDELFMNISAGDRDAYAAIHNCSPTIYDNLHRNLSHLSKLRDEARVGHPYMRLINVITEKNIGNIPAMVDFAVSIKANYVDFRKVWVFGEFLRQFHVTEKGLSQVIDRRRELVDRLKQAGIDNNLDDFFKEFEPAVSGPARSGHAESDPVPCAMSYSFSLLDVREDLRYCCRGDKRTQTYKDDVSEAWTGVRYLVFREYWRERYRNNQPICEGCPHVDENQKAGRDLIRLGLRDLV